MRWLGDNPLHTLMLLTERPAAWRMWQIGPVAVALAAAAGLLWGRATREPLLGWAVAFGLLALALADWALLALLPRRGISYGAVQPPWLALLIGRSLLALLTVPAGGRWPLLAVATLAAIQTAIWLLMAYGTLVEPFRLRVSRRDILSAKLSNPGRPLRLVHLSDLHVERLTRREQALPALVASLNPDLIVLTGDFLNTSYHDDPRALDDLRDLLQCLRAPGGVYAVWGTVEVDLPHLLRPLLQSVGVVVLEDQAVELTIQDHRLWLVGLSCSHDLAADGARLRALLAGAPAEAFSVLLYHTPDLMPQAAALGVDLYLAGHTHGGQWRVPGLGAILTSSRYWKRYEAGYYRERGTQLYVSRGVGLEGFGMPRARLFCPPEVVALTLVGEEPH